MYPNSRVDYQASFVEIILLFTNLCYFYQLGILVNLDHLVSDRVLYFGVSEWQESAINPVFPFRLGVSLSWRWLFRYDQI